MLKVLRHLRDEAHHRLGAARRRSVLLEGTVLAVLLCVVAGVWGFVELADLVADGGPALDERALLALRRDDDPTRPIGPWWLAVAALDVTALGGATVLNFVMLAVSGFLLLEKKQKAAVLVVVATLGGQLGSAGLKVLFARPRPDVVGALAKVHTSSFPSGHAMVSAVVYLTLGVLLTQLVRRRQTRIYVLSLACLLTVTVGLTRVYLGVHYPTDVLAGWIAGLVWALCCWLVARVLQRRGQIEQPGPEKELQQADAQLEE